MENNKPLISVIMGIYNCSDTLAEAVQCIENQTYQNWELIMCDDGSSDDTYKTALSLAEKDNRIIVLKNDKNLTLAPTLNRCIKAAKGSLLARMDGDDLCDPYRFEKELAFLQNNPEYAFVSCNMDLFDADGVFRTIHYSAYPNGISLSKASQFCHAGVLMRGEPIRQIGGYSESMKYRRVEDYDLWVRLYAAGYKGANLEESLYAMRDDRNAIIRRNWNNRLNESRVKLKACRLLDLPLRCYANAAVPIVKYLTPGFVYRWFHKK